MATLSLEEFMKRLLSIGFSREFVLEQGLAFVHYQIALGDHVALLGVLEKMENAVKACGIHPDQLQAEYEKATRLSHESNINKYRSISSMPA